MEKVLKIDYQKCTGCRLCELVCSVSHHGVSNPARSRIKVVKWEAEGLYVPVTCQQCEDAPCISVCPVKATYRDGETGCVTIDYDICIGCRSCVTVCPFGARSYDTKDKMMDHIKWQRAVELWGEGFSFHDKIRWDDVHDMSGSGAAEVLYQGGWYQDRPSVNKRWLWKIPQMEIEANTNIGEENQNKY